MSGLRAEAVTIAEVNGTVAMVLEPTEGVPVVAVMSADESERLRSRLHRAENAARKAEADRV